MLEPVGLRGPAEVNRELVLSGLVLLLVGLTGVVVAARDVKLRGFSPGTVAGEPPKARLG